MIMYHCSTVQNKDREMYANTEDLFQTNLLKNKLKQFGFLNSWSCFLLVDVLFRAIFLSSGIKT